MALPINIEELVHGQTIEWERLEFKEGWNPEVVIRSMCAFANDLHNWGGGYIVIGIAEEEGQPLLPPAGLQQNQLDAIQKKVLELGYKMQPNYFPIAQPYILDNRHIVVLWCPAGDNRIYLAPETLGDGAQKVPFVRVGSNSIVAKGETLRRLQELTARIPFDDRINNRASVDDLDLGLIQAYLQEVRSDLFEESKTMPFEDVCRTMFIAKGANEDIRPVNVGLLFFSTEPQQYLDRSWIELVWHQDMSGSNYREIYFKGPLQKQLRDAISFIKTNILSEQVIKLEGQAEAVRFYNFPFDAVEEALSNAVYHKSYELRNPIEIQVWPDKMEVLSYPGPIPPVNAAVLRTQRRIVAREYRNRRIGDFLKELRLTEGRGTGLPTMYGAMEANGSPEPVFETDADSTYFLVTLPAHNGRSIGVGTGASALTFNDLDEVIAFGNGASNGASNEAGRTVMAVISDEIHDRVPEILTLLINKLKRSDLFEAMDLSNQSKNRAKYLDPLIAVGWVAMEYPNEPTHPGQTYQTTEPGKRILNLINQQ
jgi:ATP-dependent DNA helicase RecG